MIHGNRKLFDGDDTFSNLSNLAYFNLFKGKILLPAYKDDGANTSEAHCYISSVPSVSHLCKMY